MGIGSKDVWTTAAWRAEAVSWLDDRLAAAGIERTGEVEQPHLRPWATALRAPTDSGAVWLKAAGSGTAFEAGLYELLQRVAPEHVLTPIATDAGRGWMLLPDGGEPIGVRLQGPDVYEALLVALPQYGELQRDLAPRAGALLDLGVADMRPSVMPRRFDEAVAAASEYAERSGRSDEVAEVVELRDTFVEWCERLNAMPGPPSLDHNDLHTWNIFLDGDHRARFYDWGDSVVAHPFACMLVGLGFAQSRVLDTTPDDPRVLRLRDAYLEVFSDLGPHAELVEALELACRVGKIARALIWDRAVRALGEEADEDWSGAPLETLASLRDESYLGGA
jgi:Phosphotransferase enzyme family